MRSSLAVTIGLIAVWLPPATFAQTQMPTPQPPQVVALAPQALSLEHGNVADVAFDGLLAPTLRTDPGGADLLPGFYAAQTTGPSLSRHLLYGAATGGALSLMLIGMADCPNSGCTEARVVAVVGYTVAGAAIGGVVYLIRKVLTAAPSHIAQ